MAVSSLPRAQIVTDLARMHRPNEPKSGGAPAGAAAIENWDSIFRQPAGAGALRSTTHGCSGVR
jgi:hypothetical protein